MANLQPYEATIGRVVKHQASNTLGHIVGFTENLSGECILVVQWQNVEEPSPIHPGNVRSVTPGEPWPTKDPLQQTGPYRGFPADPEE